MELSCIQVNVQKSRLACQLLENQLITKPHLGFISEPYTVENKVVLRPSRYKVIPSGTSDSRPRAALFIPPGIEATSLGHLCTADCAVAQVFWQGRTIVIASVYLDIDDPVVQDWLEEVVDYAERKQFGLIIGMDSNAHSYLFGNSDETNDRGEELEEFIMMRDLSVANSGAIPTFHTVRASSIIDVTLYKRVPIFDWFVCEEYNASDHNSLYFKILIDLPKFREIRPWQKANWGLFTDTLNKDRKFPDRMTTKKLDKEVDLLYRDLNFALDAACPTFSLSSKPDESKWYNERLERYHFKVKKQYRRAITTEVDDEWAKYNIMHKKFKRRCRRSKAKAWRKFVSETEDEHKMSVLYKIAQHREKNELSTLVRNDGSVTEPGKETIKCLIDIHFPSASDELDPPPYSSDRAELIETIIQKYDYINPRSVKKALQKFKPFKAAGPDGIKPVVFKYLPPPFILRIAIIYKCCIHFRYTPRKWQEATAVFIPKPGKKSYKAGKSFRPIVLSNFLLKGLERLGTWQFDKWMKNFPIHPMQHGFQVGKGTEGAISNTTDYIEKFLFKRQYCLGLFLDIASAYDSISIDHIRESLYRHGGEEDFVEWYYNYLKRRMLSITIHGETVSIICNQGFPQGGVASAKFWLIAFNPAIEILNSDFVIGNGYADDCSAVFGGTDPAVLVERMQGVLDRLVQWGETCNLHFNPEKTVAVGFTRCTRKRFSDRLHINGREISYSDSVRYLGVIFDAKLRWTTHIDDKIAKGKRLLYKMSNIAKTTWGPKPHLMRWVFTCVVRPMIIYGSIVWAKAAQTESNSKKLRHVNRLAMNTYASFHRSTPTRGLELITHTFPLHLYIMKEAVCAYVRLKGILTLDWNGFHRFNPTVYSHRKQLQHWVIGLGISDLIDNLDDWNGDVNIPTFKIVQESFNDTNHFRQYMDKQVRIFTDGSKRDGRVGLAFVAHLPGGEKVEQLFRLPDNCSVFQAEIVAYKQAALWAISQEFTEICFFSDSQAAMLSLVSNNVTSKTVADTIGLINSINATINFIWVKAHSGIEENEYVDSLAKTAANLPNVMDNPIPRNQVKTLVLESLHSTWKFEWIDYPEARQTKQFVVEPIKTKADKACRLSRLQLGRLIRIITGHNVLKYHFSLMNPLESPFCRFCGTDRETFFHFITECPPLRQLRINHFLDRDIFSDYSWKVNEILDFSYEKCITTLIDPNNVHNITLVDTSSSDSSSDND